MERRLSDMSEVEKAQFRNHKAIVDNATSTAEEQKQARLQMDALQWKGQTGPLMELITKLTARLDAVEEMGQSISEEDRRALVELRQLSKRLDKNRVEALELNIGKCLDGLAELALTEQQHRDDNQSGWSRHEADLTVAKQSRQALEVRINDMEQWINNKFRDVEAKIDTLRRDLNALIADAMDGARTTIMAEAAAAAIAAVGNLLGESEGATTQKADKP